MTGPTVERLNALLHHEPARLLAREDLLRRARLRLVARALELGASHQVIADALGVPQPTVHRMARQIENDPRALETTATEIIGLATVGEITRGEMMRRLSTLPLTYGAYDPTGGEGYIRGSWDEIEAAVGRGLLSDQEFAQLAEHSR